MLATIVPVAIILLVSGCDQSYPLDQNDLALNSQTDIAESPVMLAKEDPLPGAIFTTTVDGSIVNANNQYEDKCDVYLDGGPGMNAPIDAAGLPDGDYFFQVTDPSGKYLLSTDPVQNRQFKVEGGIITGLSGLGNHGTGVDVDHGAVTIQLCPYDDTKNPGGVYKAWATRIGDFDGDPTMVDNGYSPGYFHGFLPDFSKTDNFKVGERPKEYPSLTIVKFCDNNSNGVWDAGEDEFSREIAVYDPSGAQINGTLHTAVTLSNLVAGTYRVDVLGSQTVHRVTAALLDGQSVSPLGWSFEIEMKNKDREFAFGMGP